MNTLNKVGGHNNIKRAEFKGLHKNRENMKHLDEIPNGSSFIEIDTGLEYLFDAENLVWCEQ